MPAKQDRQKHNRNLQLPKRILVTGGAGFIGANLVRRLLERGYEVSVLDNLTVGRLEYLQGLRVRFIQGDILDTGLINRVAASQDGVIHLAAQTGVPGSLQDPRKDCETNILGTLNLLEACRSTKTKQEKMGVSAGANAPRFVFASSNAPLGRQTPPASASHARNVYVSEHLLK